MPLPYHWQIRFARWKQIFGGMFGGSGEKRPQLCPACGALVGIHANRCHECGTSLRFSLAAWSKGLSEFFGGHAPVTAVVLIVNVLMFGVSLLATFRAGEGAGISLLWSLDGRTLERLGASIPWAIFFGHQWFRLVTAMFLHNGLLHIGFNMMVLLDIGPVVEEVYGSARYLFAYIVAGIFGFLLSAVTGHFSVGASGAIVGLVGILVAITTKHAGAQIREMRSRLIGWVISIFAIGFLMNSGTVGSIRIDNMGHLGGLIAGFALGKIFADRQPAPGPERTRAYLLGWLAGAVVIAAFVFMFLHLSDPLPQ